MERVAAIFNVGKVRKSTGTNFFTYSITSLKHNLTIIDYFMRFPLKSKKRTSFEKWVHVLTALSKKEHRDPIVNEKLIVLAKTINKI